MQSTLPAFVFHFVESGAEQTANSSGFKSTPEYVWCMHKIRGLSSQVHEIPSTFAAEPQGVDRPMRYLWQNALGVVAKYRKGSHSFRPYICIWRACTPKSLTQPLDASKQPKLSWAQLVQYTITMRVHVNIFGPVQYVRPLLKAYVETSKWAQKDVGLAYPERHGYAFLTSGLTSVGCQLAQADVSVQGPTVAPGSSVPQAATGAPPAARAREYVPNEEIFARLAHARASSADSHPASPPNGHHTSAAYQAYGNGSYSTSSQLIGQEQSYTAGTTGYGPQYTSSPQTSQPVASSSSSAPQSMFAVDPQRSQSSPVNGLSSLAQMAHPPPSVRQPAHYVNQAGPSQSTNQVPSPAMQYRQQIAAQMQAQAHMQLQAQVQAQQQQGLVYGWSPQPQAPPTPVVSTQTGFARYSGAPHGFLPAGQVPAYAVAPQASSSRPQKRAAPDAVHPQAPQQKRRTTASQPQSSAPPTFSSQASPQALKVHHSLSPEIARSISPAAAAQTSSRQATAPAPTPSPTPRPPKRAAPDADHEEERAAKIQRMKAPVANGVLANATRPRGRSLHNRVVVGQAQRRAQTPVAASPSTAAQPPAASQGSASRALVPAQASTTAGASTSQASTSQTATPRTSSSPRATASQAVAGPGPSTAAARRARASRPGTSAKSRYQLQAGRFLQAFCDVWLPEMGTNPESSTLGNSALQLAPGENMKAFVDQARAVADLIEDIEALPPTPFSGEWKDLAQRLVRLGDAPPPVAKKATDASELLDKMRMVTAVAAQPAQTEEAGGSAAEADVKAEDTASETPVSEETLETLFSECVDTADCKPESSKPESSEPTP